MLFSEFTAFWKAGMLQRGKGGRRSSPSGAIILSMYAKIAWKITKENKNKSKNCRGSEAWAQDCHFLNQVNAFIAALHFIFYFGSFSIKVKCKFFLLLKLCFHFLILWSILMVNSKMGPPSQNELSHYLDNNYPTFDGRSTLLTLIVLSFSTIVRRIYLKIQKQFPYTFGKRDRKNTKRTMAHSTEKHKPPLIF